MSADQESNRVLSWVALWGFAGVAAKAFIRLALRQEVFERLADLAALLRRLIRDLMVTTDVTTARDGATSADPVAPSMGELLKVWGNLEEGGDPLLQSFNQIDGPSLPS